MVAGWVAAAAGLAVAGYAADSTNKPVAVPDDYSESYTNWVDLSVGGLLIDGNPNAPKQRHYIHQGAFGGIEDLHYESKVGKKDSLNLDVRALFDNQDYKLRLEYVRPEVGFVRAGYKAYRTWYDGSGGYYAGDQANVRMVHLYDESLHLDRGEAWIEGGLTLKDWPQIRLKYSTLFREGEKDSTSMGVTRPYGAGPSRAIVPSFLGIDEHRNIFEAEIKHKLGKTDFGLGLNYESARQNNSQNSRQYPNQLNDRHVTSRDQVWTDVLNVYGFTETRYSPKVFFSSGYSFSTLDTDIAGTRTYGASYDSAYVPALANGLGYFNLAGGSESKEFTGTFSLMYTPRESWTIVPSVRLYRVGTDSQSTYMQTGNGAPTLVNSTSSRDNLDVTEQLEIRYTGFTNWVVYARAELLEGQGNYQENGGNGILPRVDQNTDDSRLQQKYTLGLNWYPVRRVNMDFQYYHVNRDNKYTHLLDNTPNTPLSGNRYPAYLKDQNLDTDGGNVRLTLRPLNNVTLVSRYDLQYSTIHTTPDAAAGLSEAESARMISHVFAQNITWVPVSRLYLQGGFNYVISKTESEAGNYTAAVLNARNNYYTLTTTAGFVVDNKTDLQASYFYYRANDYTPDNSFGAAMSYGAGAKEQAVTCMVSRKLRPNMRLSLKYGFYSYRDEASGGWNNYDAHLIYSTLQYRF